MAPLVAAWERGEGTQAELGARAGMTGSSFAWWCRRLAGPGGRPAKGFVAVDVRPEPGPAPTAALEIVLKGGAVVRVASGFDGPTLERLLTTLSRRTC